MKLIPLKNTGVSDEVFLSGKVVMIDISVDQDISTGDVLTIETSDGTRYLANVVAYSKPTTLLGAIKFQLRKNTV